MQITGAGGGRDYTLFQAVLSAFPASDIRQVFYDTDGPGHTTISACLVIFWSNTQYIRGDWSANPILETIFLTDFPSAIKGTTQASY